MEFSFAILSRSRLFVKCFLFGNFSSPFFKPLRFQPFVSDSFARLPCLSSFVKPFFRKLFRFRLSSLDARPPSRTASLDYHAFPLLSIPFFTFFSFSFRHPPCPPPPLLLLPPSVRVLTMRQAGPQEETGLPQDLDFIQKDLSRPLESPSPAYPAAFPTGPGPPAAPHTPPNSEHSGAVKRLPPPGQTRPANLRLPRR